MPTFNVRPIAPASGKFAAEITMLTGPPAIIVDAAHYSGLAFGPPNEHGEDEGGDFHGKGPGHRPLELIRNASFWLYMDVIDGAVRADQVTIILLCEEITGEEAADSSRRWLVLENTGWPV